MRTLAFVVWFGACCVPRLLQAAHDARNEVHAFVENGDDQGGSIDTGQAEDKVVPAADHPQSRMKVFLAAMPSFAHGQSLGAALELAGVAASLSNPPLSARVTQNLSQIGFGGDGEDVG